MSRPRRAVPEEAQTVNKIPICAHLKKSSVEWIAENLPRSVSRSAFIDEAVEEKIRRLSSRR